MFSKSAFGKIISIINLACALCSFFIYWKFFDINIFISILLAIISWFFVTYILDKAIIKFWGVEQKLKKMNDEGYELSKNMKKIFLTISIVTNVILVSIGLLLSNIDVKCVCLWDRWGSAIALCLAVLFCWPQIFFVRFLVRRKSQKMFLYDILFEIGIIILYIIIIGTAFHFLTECSGGQIQSATFNQF